MLPKQFSTLISLLLILAAVTPSVNAAGPENTPHHPTAQTYYVSNSTGQDTNDGLSSDTPFQTIAKVNTLALQPGDSVLFKCGDVWRAEMLTVTQSGTQDKPITFSSYPAGCQDKPVLSGAHPIVGWTQHAGNVYVADLSAGDNAGKFPLGINQLFRDGERLPMGRWPNLDAGDGGYSTIDAQPNPDQITDNELPAGNWTGAVVHIKGMRWYILNREVTGVSGNSLTLNADAGCWDGCAGWGYFIHHHLQTLDQAGEWYYDEASKRVFVYSTGGAPPDEQNKMEGSVVLQDDGRNWGGILLGEDMHDAASYVVIDNFVIKNWYRHGISTPTNYEGDDFRGVVIQNNTIQDVDDTGIKLAVWVYNAQDGISGWRGGSQVQVNNNVIDGANHFGIDVFSRESTFSDNEIKNVGLIENLNKSGLGCGFSGSNCTENGDGFRIKLGDVRRSAYGNTLQYNRLEKIGYNGIDVFGPHNTFQYNFIQQACYSKGDCGGLRSFGRSNLSDTDVHDLAIRDNIILDTIGNTDGANAHYRPLFGMGLYIDHYSRDVEASGNTIISSTVDGILYQNSTGTINGNTLYGNNSGSMGRGQIGVYKSISHIATLNDNVLYALQENARTLKLDGKGNLTASDHNYFFNPYEAENITVDGAKTLEAWQAYSGLDGTSKKNWFTLNPGDAPLSQIFYNDTQQPRTIDLGYTQYLDLDQNVVSGSLTLPPFTSRVLIQSGELSMPDLGVSLESAGTVDLVPGAAVTYTVGVRNQGTALATGVLLTNVVPGDLVDAAWEIAPALAGTTVHTGTRYVWDLPDLAPGASGVITVSGTFSFAPQTAYALSTRASIRAAEAEKQYANNSAFLLFSGYRLYLPLAVRDQ